MINFLIKKFGVKYQLWWTKLYYKFFIFDLFLELVEERTDFFDLLDIDSLLAVIKTNAKVLGGYDSLLKSSEIIHSLFPLENVHVIPSLTPDKYDVVSLVSDDKDVSFFLSLWLKIVKLNRKDKIIIPRKIKFSEGPYKNMISYSLFIKNIQSLKSLLPLSYDYYSWKPQLYVSLRFTFDQKIYQSFAISYFLYGFKIFKVGKFPKRSVLPELYWYYRIRRIYKDLSHFSPSIRRRKNSKVKADGAIITFLSPEKI